MGDVYRLADYSCQNTWKEVFTSDDGYTELHVYLDEKSGELEIFQMVDGKGSRTCLKMTAAVTLVEALKASYAKFGGK